MYDTDRLTNQVGIHAAGSLAGGKWSLSVRTADLPNAAGLHGAMEQAARMLAQHEERDELRVVIGARSMLAMRFAGVIGVALYDNHDPVVKSLKRLMERCTRPRPNSEQLVDRSVRVRGVIDPSFAENMGRELQQLSADEVQR